MFDCLYSGSLFPSSPYDLFKSFFIMNGTIIIYNERHKPLGDN